jgi:hypothetical protein
MSITPVTPEYTLDILLLTFVSFLVALSGCSQDEALKRIGTMCAIAEGELMKTKEEGTTIQ